VSIFVAVVALTVGLVAEMTGARVVSGSLETELTGVSIDTRTMEPGMLFVAIRGDRLDGHDYVGEAAARGARALLVDRTLPATGATAVIQVSDTIEALQSLGQAVRRRSGAKVIAVTGSAGKTTTKELIADLLAARFEVFRNRGNLNNHIGLPLSLTGLASGPDIAVVELGMNHAGEIRRLIEIAEPEVRVWTNVGDAHIGHFGSRAEIAKAKAEILENATGETLAVVNADDALVRESAQHFQGRLVTFGVEHPASVRALDVEDDGFDGVGARVQTPTASFEVRLGLPGRAHLLNALAAIAVAREFGIEPETMGARLAAARPLRRRGSSVRLANGARLVDDSYNASPAATDIMLRALAATPATGRRIAVLGEMRELGADSDQLHEQCGRTAAELGIDVVIGVGATGAQALVQGARASGMGEASTAWFPDAPGAAGPLRDLLRSGDVALIKGSRATRMEALVDAIQQAETR
jgi:UDP-N-acetylmuramoyl-tripeptide--D-alanyl-D-alanine ligase